MNRLRRFMYGRYGYDQLGQFIIGVSLIVTLMGSISNSQIIVMLSYLILVLGIYRIISKNINQRRKENEKYLKLLQPLKKNFQKQSQLMLGTKTHKYYKCPQCKQTIRVPRGKGMISISCPKCKSEFQKRT